MYAFGEPIIEYAMTHTGDRRECRRPQEIRDVAQRVRGWGLSNPETCQSCKAKRATHLDTEFPICPSCRLHKSERFVRTSLENRAIDERRFVDGLIGHAIVFNSRSLDLGGFTEFIREPAVNYTLSETNPDVRALWNHDSSQTLGRTTAGTLAMGKDARGLKVGIDLPKWAGPMRESVERRDVSGMSFGFRVLDDEWHLEDGEPVRDILSMQINEVSVVTFPAYPATDVSIGSARSGRSLRDLQREHRMRMAR